MIEDKIDGTSSVGEEEIAPVSEPTDTTVESKVETEAEVASEAEAPVAETPVAETPVAETPVAEAASEAEAAEKPKKKKTKKPGAKKSEAKADKPTEDKLTTKADTPTADVVAIPTEEENESGEDSPTEEENEGGEDSPAPTEADIPTADDAVVTTEGEVSEGEEAEESEADGGDSDGITEGGEGDALPLSDVELTEAIEDEPEVADEPTPLPTEKAKHEQDKKAKQPKEGGTRRVDTVFDFIELFVFTLAIVLFISAFFLRHSVVDGDSMQNTLYSGEHLIISDFLYEPERGDIVVVEDLSTELKKPIIKRVIATAGETVRVTRDGIYVNGEKLDEPYVFTDGQEYYYSVNPSDAIRENETLVIDADYYEFTVPEGELFVLGDHRNKSSDSRLIGTVDEDAVLGRVILRLFPFDAFGRVD